MKKLSFFSLAILMCAFFYGTASYSFSKELDQKLDATVQSVLDEYHIPGVVIGIWIPNKGEWVRAMGLADKATQEKMKLDDHFKIASVTKSFAVTGILQLVDQGKLSLDDPIDKYIANVPNGDKITIRQLANMTSGLPEYADNETIQKEMFKNKEKAWTPQNLLDAAFSMPILFNPGEKYHYCNTNTLLLGLVIEKISHMSVGEYLEESIFKPLKLLNTSFPLNNQLPKPYAHGYTAGEDMSSLSPSLTFASGAMISNLHDLKIWAEALGTGKLLSKKTFKDRLDWVEIPGTPQEKKYEKYGLGIGFDQGWLMHTGEFPGYNSIIAYLPEEKAIFVCLVNSSDPIKIKDIKIPPAIFLSKKIIEEVFPKNVPIGMK